MTNTNNQLTEPKTAGSPAAACSAFQEGALVFAALMVRCFDEPFLAAQILKEMGFSKLNCGHLDEFDKSPLRKLNLEKGMKLRGLRKKPNARYEPHEGSPSAPKN